MAKFCFSKETFPLYPALTDFTQRKRKTYDSNDLLALLLVSIIGHIYSLGKKIYCIYLKTTGREMILSYAKPFNEKNTLSKCPVRCTPVASPANKFAEIASPANK